jgi:hypothetical protein
VRGSTVGVLLLVLAAVLLALEAAVVVARFAAFAGASEAVAIARWQRGDLLRLGGAMFSAVVGLRLVRASRPRP